MFGELHLGSNHITAMWRHFAVVLSRRRQQCASAGSEGEPTDLCTWQRHCVTRRAGMS